MALSIRSDVEEPQPAAAGDYRFGHGASAHTSPTPARIRRRGRVESDSGFGAIATTEAVFGLAAPAAGDAIVGLEPAAVTGGGTAPVRTVEFVAMALGVGVVGSILNGIYRSGLEGQLSGLPAQAQAAAEQSIAVAGSVPRVFAVARDAYASSMSDAVGIGAVVLVVAAVVGARFLPARVTATGIARPTPEPIGVADR